MRVTIVNADRTVGINGEFRTLDMAPLEPSIHAIQWYETYGEVEYVTKFENGEFIKPANQIITNMDIIQAAIDAWHSKAPPPDPPFFTALYM